MVNQAYIDSLITSFKTKRRNISSIMSVRGLNAIEHHLTIDLLKIDTIVRELEDYVIANETAPYEYILDLESAGLLNCKYEEEIYGNLIDSCDEPSISTAGTTAGLDTIRFNTDTIATKSALYIFYGDTERTLTLVNGIDGPVIVATEATADLLFAGTISGLGSTFNGKMRPGAKRLEFDWNKVDKYVI